MAAITRLPSGNYIAVHEVTGRRLKGQPKGGFSTTSKARAFAGDVCEEVMGRPCPHIPLKQFSNRSMKRSMGKRNRGRL